MKVAFFIKASADVHLHKNTIRELERRGHIVKILARDYGDTLALLNELGFDYSVFADVPISKLGKFIMFPIHVFRAFAILRSFRPDLLVGMGVYSAYTSRLLRKPCVIFTDSEPVPVQFLFLKPAASAIVTPSCFRRDLGERQIRVDAYKELAYLHPNLFQPDPSILDTLGLPQGSPFVILRFNAFDAIHDLGKGGFSLENKRELVNILSKSARVFVSSEEELPPDLRDYELRIPKKRIHDAISYARLVVTDTQTMTTEAAVLGTPAIRCNSFVGENDMGNFLELERVYGLIFNYSDPKEAIRKAVELINSPDIKDKWRVKKERLLSEKIDLTKFMVWFIENFPRSRRALLDIRESSSMQGSNALASQHAEPPGKDCALNATKASKTMRTAIFINTPAQAHLYRNIVTGLQNKGHKVQILARRQGETTAILDEFGLFYSAYGKASHSKLGKALSFPGEVLRSFVFLKHFNPDLVLDVGMHGAFAAGLLRRTCVLFNDSEPIPVQFLLSMPFVSVIITPSAFRRDLGRKHVKIDSFKEIAYLHPSYYSPDERRLDRFGLSSAEPFVLLRFNAFRAVHDIGIKGFSIEEKHRLVNELSRYARVVISSESDLPPDLAAYSIKAPGNSIHDIIRSASLLVADTQTMVTEAAVLGTPAIRCNSFAGKKDMGNFLELEEKYGLIFNYSDPNEAIEKAIELINIPDAKVKWKIKQERLLNDKIDVTRFMIWFVGNFPESIRRLNENSSIENRILTKDKTNFPI